ncbi:NEW3 domain-containing protein [Zhouia sp. PK063]|uniref:COG1470 family protein n=1 Tax=Zhouia sp. PK063 TaxID=3373602 RepID=UPI00378B5E7B
MLACKKRLPYLILSFLVLSVFSPQLSTAQSVSLYTPYTSITVPPGQSIDYAVDIINNTGAIKSPKIEVTGLPKDWSYNLKSGGYTVEEVSELPREKEKVTLKVNVPLKVDKGTYHFNIIAPGYSSLPLTVTVSKQGNYNAEFSSDQINIEGAANSTFTYNAQLRNGTEESKVYALHSLAQPGWEVTYRSNGKQVSSVNIDANQTQRITVQVHPPSDAKAGKYDIPVLANAGSITTRLNLQAAITGSYKLELTTPTGLLSTDVTSGDERKVKLEVKNTGSVPLNNVTLMANTPAKWDVTFNPKTVKALASGKSEEVYATIKVADKALAGDYETEFEAKSSQTSTNAKFRVTVKTSMLSGWLGILIILMALGSVYTLIKKYGRR